MILQYANDGNLREYLKTNFKRLKWTDKLYFAKNIALGLLFLHENKIVHRDLHSKNILIHEKQPKIADFGLSKQINEMSMTSNSIIHGMPAYVEPQCLVKKGYKRDERSDIYSFGVILWEISSGRPPFQTFESKMELCFHIFQGNREERIEGTPLKYVDLYEQCWNKEPANRPETKSILNTLNQLISNDDSNQPENLIQSENSNPSENSNQSENLNQSETLNQFENFSSSQYINTHANSLEITTSSPLPDMIEPDSRETKTNPNPLSQGKDILMDNR
ncbi:kinase-like protein [Gigaspora margarita]|nr:kinase-like protein [Gigaspora margarita]